MSKNIAASRKQIYGQKILNWGKINNTDIQNEEILKSGSGITEIWHQFFLMLSLQVYNKDTVW